jgi:hypothetical protein
VRGRMQSSCEVMHGKRARNEGGIDEGSSAETFGDACECEMRDQEGEMES